MNGWLFLTPLVCSGLGWAIHRLAFTLMFYPTDPLKLAGWRLQGLLPRRRPQLTAKLAEAAAAFMPDAAALEAIVAHPAHFQTIMPVIEEQIDHFLRVKLKQSMPVVGMFVGDKTIGQLKAVFVTELEEIFPTVMKNYAAALAGEFDIKRLIGEKLSVIPPETLSDQVRKAMKKELLALQWLGAITGFCAGLLAILLVLLLK